MASGNLALVAAIFIAIASVAAVGYMAYRNMSLADEFSRAQAQNDEQMQKLYDAYGELNLTLARQDAQLLQRDAEIARANSKLNQSNSDIDALRLEISQKDAELAEARGNLGAEQAKSAAIVSELSGLERSINESMAWFRDNAALPQGYGWKSDIFQKRVADDCVYQGELNLACVSYLMENTAFAIHYRTDSESKGGKADYLQSVRETMDSGWGDCEDYSLFFKALINTLRTNGSIGQPNLTVWIPGGEANFRVYPNPGVPAQEIGSYWYVPNAKKQPVGNLGSVHPYVVCYRNTASTGHCTVALSDRAIASSSDIGALAGARVFEPQNGRYLGTVGSEFTVCSSNDCFANYRDIGLVIADNDLYKFQNGKWAGYADYALRVESELAAFRGAPPSG